LRSKTTQACANQLEGGTDGSGIARAAASSRLGLASAADRSVEELLLPTSPLGLRERSHAVGQLVFFFTFITNKRRSMVVHVRCTCLGGGGGGGGGGGETTHPQLGRTEQPDGPHCVCCPSTAKKKQGVEPHAVTRWPWPLVPPECHWPAPPQPPIRLTIEGGNITTVYIHQ